MDNDNSDVSQSFSNLFKIWLGLLVTQSTFLVVLPIIKPDLDPFDISMPILGNDSMPIIVLALISASLFVSSFVVRASLIKRAIGEGNVSLVQTAVIVGCALAEGISILGVLVAVVFDYSYYYLYFAVGIFAVLLHFPRKSDLDAVRFKRTL